MDADPGLDDLLALATALASPELDVVGVSTVAGSAPIEVVTENVQRFFTLCRVDLPLGRGAARPRALEPVHATHAHGDDGRGGVSLPAIDRRPLPTATDVLRQSLARGARQVIALGPLTNLAELLASDPARLEGVEVVWMGGALEGGDITPQAEFNCRADPHAAHEVLAALPVRVIGLDVTRHVQMWPTDFAEPPFGPGRVGRFLADVLRALMDSETPVQGGPCARLHEASAVLAACDPGLFRYATRWLRIQTSEGALRGQMCESGPVAGAISCRYAVEAHVAELRRRLRDRLCAWTEACE